MYFKCAVPLGDSLASLLAWGLVLSAGFNWQNIYRTVGSGRPQTPLRTTTRSLIVTLELSYCSYDIVPHSKVNRISISQVANCKLKRRGGKVPVANDRSNERGLVLRPSRTTPNYLRKCPPQFEANPVPRPLINVRSPPSTPPPQKKLDHIAQECSLNHG